MSIKAKIKTNNISLESAIKEKLKGAFSDKTLEIGFFETAKYENGAYVASVAKWNDFGTLRIPPRPFFRNAISENNKKWLDILKMELQKNNDLDLTFNRVGEVAKGDIVISIDKTNSPSNADSTIKIKKSSKPLISTGFMKSSVNYKVV